MATKYWLDNGDDWSTAGDWTGGSLPGSGDDVVIYQGSPHVSAPIAVRSITLSSPATLSFENAGANTLSATLTNSGSFFLDNNGGTGGTSLAIAGRLSNTGYLQIGNGSLARTTTVTARFLDNIGTIELDGAVAQQSQLIVGAGAGFGTVGVLTGAVRLFGDTLLSFTAGQISSLAVGSYLRLSGANAFLADAGSTTSNSALTGLNSIGRNAQLFIDSGASIAAAGTLTNDGSVYVDYYGGEGAGSLSVASRLTNLGYLQIGNGGLSASDTVSVQYLTNKGTIDLAGTNTAKATLAVGFGAGFGTGGVLSGTVQMSGSSVISFTANQIKTLAAGSYLRLNGTQAFIADVGSTTSNSALTGLNTIGRNAQLLLDNGATIAAAGALTNAGSTYLDYYGNEGGSTLTIAARLTNSGYLQIGNGGLSATSKVTAAFLSNTGTIELDAQAATTPTSVPRAILTVNNAAGFGATGSVAGTVRLFGNTLVSFANGLIQSLASNSYLRLDGATAFVADASDTNSNSALTGLGTVHTGAQFFLDNGAAVSTTRLVNEGSIDLDYYGGESGAALTVATTLDNEGYLQVGNGGNNTLADQVTAKSLINYGTINLYGGSKTGTLVVGSAAGTGIAGHLSGTVSLSGSSLLQFASGQIQEIDGTLRINGTTAFVADAGSTTANSALTGLTEVDGTLMLDNSATVTTGAGLLNNGTIELDYFGGDSGSTLTVHGLLDNENYIQIGNTGETIAEVVTVDGFTNASTATLNINGGSTVSASLIVNAAAGFGATGEVTGSVYLVGKSLLQFANGQIQAIDADGHLRLNGTNAFVADAGNTASNSALQGLNEVDGTLYLDNGASIATSGPLTNTGQIFLDYNYTESSSTLSVGGAFDNENYLQVGNGGQGVGETVTATSLTNNGVINLDGNQGATPTALATLAISGSVTNNGSIVLNNDKQTFSGAVGGTGSMTLQSGTTLELDGTVASPQTVAFSGADTLVLGSAKTFSGAIGGFGSGDVIDVKSFANASFSFAENRAGTAGVLTVTSGANVASLAFNGNYTTASFVSGGTDGTGGTLIAHA